MKGTVTVEARKRRCPSCGGVGGRHVVLGCATLREEARRELSKTNPKGAAK